MTGQEEDRWDDAREALRDYCRERGMLEPTASAAELVRIVQAHVQPDPVLALCQRGGLDVALEHVREAAARVAGEAEAVVVSLVARAANP